MLTKILILFGGKSLEKGISINSARSLYDHLTSSFEVDIIYINSELEFYDISKIELYSNTSDDFEYKLENQIEASYLIQKLNEYDLVIPALHGIFGEDGEVQKFLEMHNIPFLGSPSNACHNLFNKDLAKEIMKENGINIANYILIEKDKILPSTKILVAEKFIVKPTRSGSSIGVEVTQDINAALEKAQILKQEFNSNILIEEYINGAEFSIMLIEYNNIIIPLIPTEIELTNSDIFDYRKKYLPTNERILHTPARFNIDIINQIRKDATKIFKIFGAKDILRVDGFYDYKENRLIYSDLNPITGFEQNSFFFKQAAIFNIKHAKILYKVIENALSRYNKIPNSKPEIDVGEKIKIPILFGGENAERQVSVLSGTNIYFKLLYSKIYEPIAYFLSEGEQIIELPFKTCLNSTTEEIILDIQTINSSLNLITKLNLEIRKNLNLPEDIIHYKKEIYSLDEFLKLCHDNYAMLFIGLHGGIGENGVLQAKCDALGLKYNGSGATASNICMNKMVTNNILYDHKLPLYYLKKINFSIDNIPQDLYVQAVDLFGENFIIKPADDGCSAGVILVTSRELFNQYISAVKNKDEYFHNIILSRISTNYILEEFIQTDQILFKNGKIDYTSHSGWSELSVGFLNEHILTPSLTVATSNILSLEEKFQSGTGINLTPPPENILSKGDIDLIKAKLCEVIRVLGLKNYGRIDIFFNINNKELAILEANSLPALTPSTIIYHQAMAEDPPLFPITFLEQIIFTSISS